MSLPSALKLTALTTLPEVHPEDRLATLIIEACNRENVPWIDGNVVVIAQKVVSKAEDAIVDLSALCGLQPVPSLSPESMTRTRGSSS